MRKAWMANKGKQINGTQVQQVQTRKGNGGKGKEKEGKEEKREKMGDKKRKRRKKRKGKEEGKGKGGRRRKGGRREEKGKGGGRESRPEVTQARGRREGKLKCHTRSHLKVSERNFKSKSMISQRTPAPTRPYLVQKKKNSCNVCLGVER